MLCCVVLQDGDFHIARISVKQEVAKDMTDNDLLLLTKDHPQDENCRSDLETLVRHMHACTPRCSVPCCVCCTACLLAYNTVHCSAFHCSTMLTVLNTR